MDPVEKLLAIEEIKILKARYFRYADQKDLEGVRSLFTDDAEQDFREACTDPQTGVNLAPNLATVLRGVDEIIAAFKANRHKFVSFHRGYMPEIEITSPTTATGIWTMTDIVRPVDRSAGGGFEGHGYYYEDYAKVGSAWKIKRQKLVRQLFIVLQGDGKQPSG